ncbi:MAG TPA: glycosyltransferase family 4 protein [Chitinophagaceae bacterium]|nr:glycosyltransferase family 4 protein [Chitinophagaceae bacterium]HQX73866.1 glycosyltransferase family 4 protein [Chitinophagaceae bacterium]HQZ75183.1 glycosyltransferase family 4 protein [Chitinophagaceae bacterium]
MNRHLHIVCLDVPSPADYGGAIDMLYRIESLYNAGIKIHLHYFSYNHRGNPNELNQYCESIHVYERKTGHKGFSFSKPYIVSSRINQELITKLNKDNHPILLEGVHCTGILPQLNTGNRKVIVRLHNDEADYYKQLSSVEKNIFKKIYFRYESHLLSKYEHSLPPQYLYACITTKDEAHFREQHGLKNSFFLPAYTPYEKINSSEGIGNFCLYHGNLSVPENEKAATWLLTKVFSKIKVPFVIAGKNPSKRVDKLSHLYQHTCLVANPTDTEINDLVKKAHINILPSFSNTGIKIKLLHALFEGRHCVTNEAMVNGTDLEAACHIGTNANAIAAIIMQLHHQPFTTEEIRLRENLLGNTYNNALNTKQLIQYLW